EADEINSIANYIHIRLQRRNGRKSLTTVQGLAEDLDVNKILKYLRKTYSTNGTVVNDKEFGSIIQLQGDQRKNVANFFIRYSICKANEIKVHGT
ncbi:Eukaryotic translation initiation factor 1b, partial [Bonamia ostreae]